MQTCLVWCSVRCAGGHRNIILVSLMIAGRMDILFLYHSTTSLRLHFSYIAPAKEKHYELCSSDSYISLIVVVAAGINTFVLHDTLKCQACVCGRPLKLLVH